MNRKPTGPVLKTWQFYSACIHILDKSFLAKLYKKSDRQIERWSSDPDTTESHQRNPIDRYESLLSRLMELGRSDIARSAVARQCHIVGCDLSLSIIPESDKKTLAEECLDDLPAVSQFHAVLIDPNSTIEQVRHALMETFEEINENYSKWCDERGVEP